MTPPRRGNTPLFSVIVPTYGRPALLGEAIGSVLAQTVRDLECIVVDDASPQPVTVAPDPRVTVIRRDANGGTAAARNTGLDAARGTYVTFLDDDDLLTPDRLELALRGLARAPVAVCWSRYLDLRGDGRGRILEGDVRHTILDGIAPHTGRTALPRELAPRFDERFRGSEDVEWWLRLAQLAPVATVPRVGYLVRRHAGVRHTKGVGVRIRDRLRLLEMYPEYFDAHPRAAAFAWKRVGLMAQREHDHGAARRAFARSLRLRPEIRAAWHLARSLPRRSTVSAGTR